MSSHRLPDPPRTSSTRLTSAQPPTTLDRPLPGKKLKKPKAWQHTEPITSEQLAKMREDYWDTIHHYGGHKEIWDALRAASEADQELAETIVESAGIIVTSNDLSTCYDERGALYELPNYVLSEPTNLTRNSQPNRQPDSQPDRQPSNQPDNPPQN